MDGSTSRWIDDLALDDQDEGRRRATRQPSRPRSRALLVAAAIPWLLVVALLVLPGRVGGGGDRSAPDDELVPGEVTAEPDAQLEAPGEQPPGDPPSVQPHEQSPPGLASLAGDASTPPGGAQLDLHELRGSWRVEPGPEEAAALAVVVARSWLTSLEPRLELAGVDGPGGHRYAEHLVVEAVEQPSRGAAVVTILAVVLEGEDPLTASVARLAVPIAWDHHGPRPAGEPWPLPAPALTAQPLETLELLDPDDHEAALVALHLAGYLDVELSRLGASDAGPVVAEVRARTADGAVIDGPVWLRHHLDGFIVSGTTLAGTRTEPDAVDTDSAAPLDDDPERAHGDDAP